jgi:hypothetical protein
MVQDELVREALRAIARMKLREYPEGVKTHGFPSPEYWEEDVELTNRFGQYRDVFGPTGCSISVLDVILVEQSFYLFHYPALLLMCLANRCCGSVVIILNPLRFERAPLEPEERLARDAVILAILATSRYRLTPHGYRWVPENVDQL